ncbi:MAG: peptidyl-prolyl cis-trans isomerase [Gammaproteobacteria bacterium]|nr:peptidyl-prolyl cis-trans isomerase [Gammaproteobacteria bacterium]MCP5425684.1 peptidyl-prolyl cis-trans isomerase [Gammaproteobacteria bacterium]MCP5459715.1 peptidyl-prolyl cis-trans isomerase [Gammaproteobacteria bacterium]
MFRLLLAGLTLLLTTAPVWAAGIKVTMNTSLGVIVLELDPDKAPQTVANFVQYAKSGFYQGTVFHRVIPDFMIQGGGFTPDFQEKDTRPPIPNEASNGLKNARGSIAMARTPDPNSATAQFFINLKDNAFLDYPAQDGWGYAVFGRVVEGMDVVDQIGRTPTGSSGPFSSDVPQTPVVIEKVDVETPSTPE